MTTNPLSSIKTQFPILSTQVHNRPLVYLDNSATTQKPLCVLEVMNSIYTTYNANVHRGTHYLAQQCTIFHEQARETVRRFINAPSSSEILFTRGTTESINLVASCFGEAFMQAGSEVILTEMEHHSNIVPWQLLAERKGIIIKVCPITDEGRLDLDTLSTLFSPRTKLLSCAHISNVLGTLNPIEDIIKMAHTHGVPVLIDGAQSTPHIPVDVQALDCDFFAFSGHKIYGPTGIGILYGKEEYLEKMPPYMGGGEMIESVSFKKTTFNQLPYKFEAGTPNYVASVGLARALDFVTEIGFDTIHQHERQLTVYARQRLSEISGLHFYGTSDDAVISFNIDGIHHFDLVTLLDHLGIALRSGHHCAQPLMQRFGIDGTLRASFAIYNTTEDIDALLSALHRIIQMF